MSDVKKTVVLVGHCGPDASALGSAIRLAVPNVQFLVVNDDAELERAKSSATLMLVNRVLEGDFEVPAGVELAGKLVMAGMKVMLVSNYADAQSEAVKAGAMPGIGKTTMYSDESRARLRDALS